jgi:plastocyanin
MKGEHVRKRLLVVGLLVAVLSGGCGGDDPVPAADGGDGAGESVALTAADFAFEPSSLSAAAGSTIEFSNEDDAKHNFTVEEAGLDEDADAASSVSISLANVEPGSYEFFCEYHRDSMTGTLEVTE